MGRGWSSELESLQNFPPSTAIGSDVLLLPDKTALRRVGDLADMSAIFLSPQVKT